MRLRTLLRIAVASSPLLVVAPARAETYRYRLDPAATEVRFLVDATMHKVRGTAALDRGEIRFDAESGAAQGEIVVDATSAETGNAKRDRDMHVKVLESESHPEIVLVVEGFEGDFDPRAPGEVVVEGRLRIHGAEHPVRLAMKLEPAGDRLGATTSFVVPYVEWGMKNPSKAFLRVAKQVDVTIVTQGQISVAR